MAIKELDRMVGAHRLILESDFPQLNYIKSCAREAFRLYPIMPFNLPRVSLSETTVASYFIRKGSHVLLSPSGLGRNPRIWDDPLTFYLKRHLKDDGSEVALTDTKLRLLSFNTARRGCAGVFLAKCIDLAESRDSLFMAKPLLALARPRLAENLYPTVAPMPLPLPPSPFQWPIIGNLNAICTNKPVFRWIHRLMQEMNTEILCLRFFSTHVIVVSSDDLATEFLKIQDTVFSSRPVCLAAEIISSGYQSAALSPMGDQWKKMRRVLASEILSQNRHKWLLNKRNEEADNLVRYVYNQACSSLTGGVVNVRVIAQHYCGNVIRKLIFNKRFFGTDMEDGGPGAEEEEHVDALFTILAYLYSFCVSDYVGFLRKRLDLDGHEKIIRKAVESVRKYQDPLIEERARQWKNGTKTEREDLLDVMLSLEKEGTPILSIDEVKAQVVEMMLATVDNPSNAIEWAIAEMINQPHTLQRAIEELDRVVGTHRLVQESDLPELNYIKSCAREAFRLHPIAPFNVPHVSMSETTVAGYFVPKGSHVLLSRPGLGRNPRIWDDPLTFNPERHLRDDGTEVALTDTELRILSFSTGRRGCAGVLLGSTITTMLLARLLQGFTWSAPPTEQGIDLAESCDSLFMAKPLLALARPRLAENLYPTVVPT
ncbi:hypothetical protein LguiB_000614 [Lonicera macranthoides]